MYAYVAGNEIERPAAGDIGKVIAGVSAGAELQCALEGAVAVAHQDIGGAVVALIAAVNAAAGKTRINVKVPISVKVGHGDVPDVGDGGSSCCPR